MFGFFLLELVFVQGGRGEWKPERESKKAILKASVDSLRYRNYHHLFFIRTVFPNKIVGCGLFRSLKVSNIETLHETYCDKTVKVGRSNISTCVMSFVSSYLSVTFLQIS